VHKVNQTMTNETFLLPPGCCLTDCFRCLVYDPSSVETQTVAQTTFIPVCRCLRHDEANDTSAAVAANISGMPTICRAMLAISVEPAASTSAATGSKKRGR